jgi:hypothetical protein
MRLFEVLRTRPSFSPLGRVLHVALPLDLRTVERRPPRIDLRLGVLGLVTGWGGISLLLLGARISPPVAPWSSIGGLERTLVASVGAYLIGDAADMLLRFVLLLGGFSTPRFQLAPIRSVTLAEFWGRRWNRIVGSWLKDNCFTPLARRGRPGAGVLVAFAVSAAFHVAPVLLVVGLAPSAWIGCFFLAHGALVAVERVLRVRRWPAPFAHLFVVAAFVATAPLFIEPYLRGFGL